MENKDEGLPEELQHKLHAFDESLTEVEDVLKPFLKIPISDLHDKVSFAAIVIVLTRNIQAWLFTGIIIETLPMLKKLAIPTLQPIYYVYFLLAWRSTSKGQT